MPRVYCVVHGCLNSARTRSGLSFFKLPIDLERRFKWLHLISRENLQYKTPRNYTVCEKHFEDHNILPRKYRKKLKNYALPSLHLPGLAKKDAHTSTQAPRKIEMSTQTDAPVTFITNVSTQTSEPTEDDERKRKRKSDLSASGSKNKKKSGH